MYLSAFSYVVLPLLLWYRKRHVPQIHKLRVGLDDGHLWRILLPADGSTPAPFSAAGNVNPDSLRLLDKPACAPRPPTLTWGMAGTPRLLWGVRSWITPSLVIFLNICMSITYAG